MTPRKYFKKWIDNNTILGLIKQFSREDMIQFAKDYHENELKTMSQSDYTKKAKELYDKPLNSLIKLEGQKFSVGEVVKIVKPETWFSKLAFEKDPHTLYSVEYAHGQKYGGNNVKTYSLTDMTTGSTSAWYYESELKRAK